MKIEQMSEGLTRQRRNLISISCVLIFLKFAGVKIDKLSFLGLDFSKIGNPPALYLAIWLFFLYFLIRYYQYFSQEGLPRLFQCNYVYLEKIVMRYCAKLAKKISENANYHPQQLIALQQDEFNIRITYQNGRDEVGGTIVEVVNTVFPKIKYNLFRIKSLTHLCINTSIFSDYILPFILALATIIYCYSGADSSLVHAIKNGVA